MGGISDKDHPAVHPAAQIQDQVLQKISRPKDRGRGLIPPVHADKGYLIHDKERILRFIRSQGESAEAVVPVCDSIADLARAAGARRIEILRDISLLPTSAPYDPARGFRTGPPPITGTTILYIGNLETYQGIDLLLDSFVLAAPSAPDASLVIVGGRPDDLARYRARAAALPPDIASRIHFLGPRPVADMPHLFHDADILVSPRTQGNNTPMKIYSYLDSSRPILATDLPTHTQVLTPTVALLAPPSPRPFADALLRLLRAPALRSSLATSAKSLATARHTLPAYRTTLSRLYPPALRAE